MSIIVYMGSPSSIHQHWSRRMAGLDPSVRKASRVLVPNARLAAVLKARMAGAPDIMAIEPWLELSLPQHIMRAPRGSWEMLSELAIKTVLPAPLRDTSGLARAAADIVRRARTAGLSRLPAVPTDRLPWDRLAEFVDHHFSGPAVDALRLYEYAAKSRRVPLAAPGPLFLYGFCRLSKPLLGWLGHQRHNLPIEIWALSATLDAASRTWLARWDAQVIELPDVAEPVTIHAAAVAVSGDPVRAAARQMAREGLAPDRTVVAVADTADIPPLARAWADAGLLDDEVILKDPGEALWQLFLATDRPQAGREAWRRRFGRTPEADRWVSDWWARVDAVPAWSALAPLVDEASTWHGATEAWAAVAREAQRLAIFDQWQIPPSVDRIRRVFADLWEAIPRGWPILPLDEAVWVPSERWVVAGSGGFPRAVPRLPFDGDAAVRSWIGQVWPETLDEALLGALRQDAGWDGWWMLPEANGQDGQEWAGSAVDAERVHAWYHDWRESPNYTAYTGAVDPALVGESLPGRLSPSALEAFGRCPLSFLLGRVARVHEVEEPRIDVDPRLTGQWAHRALELMVKRGSPLSVAAVKHALDEAMAEHPAPAWVAPFFVRYQADRLASELYEALLRDAWSPDVSSQVEVEMRWQFIFPLQGRLDRVDYLPDGTVRLVDYKTGVVANPQRLRPAHLQLVLYQQALTDQLAKPVHAELFGISQKAGYQHRMLTPEQGEAQRPALERLLQGMRVRMHAGEFFPVPDPKEQPCRSCTFRDVCPAQAAHYVEGKRGHHPEFHGLWQAQDEEERDHAAD